MRNCARIKGFSSRLAAPREVEKRAFSILDDLSNTQKEIDDLMNRYFENLDSANPMFVKRINLLAFISKILEVNSHFLKTFVNTYKLTEPVVSTVLARGIFELHLVLLEAISGDEGFLRVIIKSGDAYESFTEMLLQIMEQKGDAAAIRALYGELERFALWEKKFEKLLKTDFKSKVKRTPYLSFKGLADKHGLSGAYDFEYRLLSSFVHPSLLYLITTKSKDKTVSKEKRQLAKLNIERRKQLVKFVATYVALDLSSRTISKVKKIIDSHLSLHVHSAGKVVSDSKPSLCST